MDGEYAEILGLSSSDQRDVKKARLQHRQQQAKLKKKPSGMSREVWSLISTNDGPPSIMPTDRVSLYEHGQTGGEIKKNFSTTLGLAKPRHWGWCPFANSARNDGLVLHHWVREDMPLYRDNVDTIDQAILSAVPEASTKDPSIYHFAKYNKQPDIVSPTDEEWKTLASEGIATTDDDKKELLHLLDLGKRFDLRWPIIVDRWNRAKFPNRTMEDLKHIYYSLSNAVSRLRHGVRAADMISWDHQHERRRKQQLSQLFNRTASEVAEEEYLVNELKRIEQRKRDREKKTQQLQKLFSTTSQTPKAAASGVSAGSQMHTPTGDATRKRALMAMASQSDPAALSSIMRADVASLLTENAAKFTEPASKLPPGVSLRSTRLKLPSTVTQKKSKALQQVLDEFGLAPVMRNVVCTEEILSELALLRSDADLLATLRQAHQDLKYQVSLQNAEETAGSTSHD